MLDLIVSGGRVVRDDGESACDIGVRGETIVEVAPRIDGVAARRVDATGLSVLPGLIDPHVHFGLRASGTRTSDDVAGGTAAALHGGVTTVIDFTQQRPGEGLVESLHARLEEFAGVAACDYALHVNVTDFPSGFPRRIEGELRSLAGLGARSLKIFTAYGREGMRIPSEFLPILLRHAAATGLGVLVHAEDDALVRAAEDRLAAAGASGVSSYPRSRPAEAETRAIGAVIETAIAARAPIYFVHVSTEGGARAIRDGRRRAGSGIFMETCPQYLILDAAAYDRSDGARFLVAPPLRSSEDRNALMGALSAGEIDVVATDHCAFRNDQKDPPPDAFREVPKGLPGVETRLVLLHTFGVLGGRIGMSDLVRLTSTNPARIFGLAPRKGSIAPGSDADLVLFDPQARWTISAGACHMETDFSPYAGIEAWGRVRGVWLRGREVLAEGARVGGPCGRRASQDALRI